MTRRRHDERVRKKKRERRGKRLINGEKEGREGGRKEGREGGRRDKQELWQPAVAVVECFRVSIATVGPFFVVGFVFRFLRIVYQLSPVPNPDCTESFLAASCAIS